MGGAGRARAGGGGPDLSAWRGGAVLLHPEGPWGRLSPRERAVVGHLIAGLARKQIARRLGVREETVKTQLASVYKKLGVRGRHDLALRAWLDGW